MQLYNFGHSIVQKSLLLLLSLFPILMPVVVCFFWAPDNLITQVNDCCDRWTEAERYRTSAIYVAQTRHNKALPVGSEARKKPRCTLW